MNSNGRCGASSVDHRARPAVAGIGDDAQRLERVAMHVAQQVLDVGALVGLLAQPAHAAARPDRPWPGRGRGW